MYVIKTPLWKSRAMCAEICLSTRFAASSAKLLLAWSAFRILRHRTLFAQTGVQSQRKVHFRGWLHRSLNNWRFRVKTANLSFPIVISPTTHSARKEATRAIFVRIQWLTVILSCTEVFAMCKETTAFSVDFTSKDFWESTWKYATRRLSDVLSLKQAIRASPKRKAVGGRDSDKSEASTKFSVNGGFYPARTVKSNLPSASKQVTVALSSCLKITVLILKTWGVNRSRTLSWPKKSRDRTL